MSDNPNEELFGKPAGNPNEELFGKATDNPNEELFGKPEQNPNEELFGRESTKPVMDSAPSVKDTQPDWRTPEFIARAARGVESENPFLRSMQRIEDQMSGLPRRLTAEENAREVEYENKRRPAPTESTIPAAPLPSMSPEQQRNAQFDYHVAQVQQWAAKHDAEHPDDPQAALDAMVSDAAQRRKDDALNAQFDESHRPTTLQDKAAVAMIEAARGVGPTAAGLKASAATARFTAGLPPIVSVPLSLIAGIATTIGARLLQDQLVPENEGERILREANPASAKVGELAGALPFFTFSPSAGLAQLRGAGKSAIGAAKAVSAAARLNSTDARAAWNAVKGDADVRALVHQFATAGLLTGVTAGQTAFAQGRAPTLDELGESFMTAMLLNKTTRLGDRVMGGTPRQDTARGEPATRPPMPGSPEPTGQRVELGPGISAEVPQPLVLEPARVEPTQSVLPEKAVAQTENFAKQSEVAQPPAMVLESVTQEQLAREAALAAQRRAIAEKQSERIGGSAGDIYTGDMFDPLAGEAPLFTHQNALAPSAPTEAAPTPPADVLAKYGDQMFQNYDKPAVAPAEQQPITLKRTFTVPFKERDSTPVLNYIVNNGGIRSKTTAQRLGKRTGGEYDDLPTFQELAGIGHHVFGGPKGGTGPDVMAQMLYKAGRIPEPSPAVMADAIRREYHSIRSMRAQDKAQEEEAKDQQRIASKQAKDFKSAAVTPRAKKGKQQIDASELTVGSTVKIGKETLRVTEIDADTMDVVLEDGKKYGRVVVKDGTTLYVDKAEVNQIDMDSIDLGPEGSATARATPMQAEQGPAIAEPVEQTAGRKIGPGAANEEDRNFSANRGDGLKQANTDIERQQQGIPPREKKAEYTDEDAIAYTDQAFKANPRVGEQLVDDLEKTSRLIHKGEFYVLRRHLDELWTAKNDAAERTHKGTEEERAKAQVEFDDLYEKQRRAYEIKDKYASAAGAGLQAQKDTYDPHSGAQMEQDAESFKARGVGERTLRKLLGAASKVITKTKDYESTKSAHDKRQAESVQSAIEREERRLKNKTLALERKRNELALRLEQGDITRDPRKAPEPLSASDQRIADEIADIQKNLEALRAPERKGEQMDARRREYLRRVQEGDLLAKDPARHEVALTEEVQRKQIAMNEAKAEYDLARARAKYSQRSMALKWMSAITFVKRELLLSGLIGLQKIGAFALVRPAMLAADQLAGMTAGRVMPGLVKGGRYEAGLLAAMSAEKKAAYAFLTEGLREAVYKARHGHTQIELASGPRKLNVAQEEFRSFFGRLHMLEKTPVWVNEYRRSAALRLRGMPEGDLSPMELRTIHELAMLDADNAILMGKTPAGLSGLTSAKNPYLEQAYRFLLPIKGVQTNYIMETMNRSGAGVPVGVARAAAAYMRGIDTVPLQVREAITRQIAQGMVGSAAWLYAFARNYFKHDDKRLVEFGGVHLPREDKGDLDEKSGTVTVAGVKMPRSLIHNPLLEAAQAGETFYHLLNDLDRKDGTVGESIPAAFMQIMVAQALELPQLKIAYDMGKAAHEGKMRDFANKQLISWVTPQMVQGFARWRDTKGQPWDTFGDTQQRKPEKWYEYITEGIPGLRERIPAKPPADRYEDMIRWIDAGKMDYARAEYKRILAEMEAAGRGAKDRYRSARAAMKHRLIDAYDPEKMPQQVIDAFRKNPRAVEDFKADAARSRRAHEIFSQQIDAKD